MSKATKWRKVGDEYRRGVLRVRRAQWNHPVEWQARVVVFEGTPPLRGGKAVTRDTRISWHRTPEAAMKAADKWAAKMLKALAKMEGRP